MTRLGAPAIVIMVTMIVITGLADEKPVRFKDPDDVARNIVITGPSTMQIRSTAIGTSKPLMIFHADGRVTADPDLKPDAAAAAIIDIFVKSGWLKPACEQQVPR